MAMLGDSKIIPTYPCPMCRSPVYASAFRCPSCGTDLTRMGAVLSSSGAAIEKTPNRRRRGLRVALLAAVAFGIAAGTVGRPWVDQVAAAIEQFMSPRVAVVRGAAMTGLQSVQRRLARQVDTVRPAAGVASKSTPDPVSPVAVAPAAPVPAAAALTISSTPRGARVQIDGVARGVTPVTIKELRPGPHKIRVSHRGYRPVTRTVPLVAGKTVAVAIRLSAQTAPTVAKPVPPAPKLVSVRQPATAPLEIGRVAPRFVAKDRIGILYRTEDFRGQRLVILFVQQLDGEAQRIIRELNALRAAEAVRNPLVVVVRPDRTAIRQFILADRIEVPVLFGSPMIARAYGADGEQFVLYLVSEQGRVMRRQVGRIDPRIIAN